jgi:CrcB protein
MLIYVALGSALGGITRYLVAGMVQRMWEMSFPIGTLFVNLSGSLFMGAFLRYAVGVQAFSPQLRVLLTVGFCGGYTTFSAFSYDTMVLLDASEWMQAAGYVLASVLLSLLGIYVGSSLGRFLLTLQPHT